MKVYLDVSCLNRPFDDQTQERVRLEAEAVMLVLERCYKGTFEQVSSSMARIEISASPDHELRNRIEALLPPESGILEVGELEFDRAEALQEMGFKAADAVHLAAAEQVADVFLTCDDRLRNGAKRRASALQVRVLNPIDFVREIAP